MVTSPVHTTKGSSPQRYTTALPNTGIYDMSVSTNTCTSGVLGDQKQCTSVHSLLLSRQKRGKNRKEPNRPENRQYLPKLVLRIQNLFIFRTTNIKNSYSNSTWQSRIILFNKFGNIKHSINNFSKKYFLFSYRSSTF